MIAHSIRAALASGIFDRILVSTDDEAIACVARDAGAETPFMRPPELADDHAGTDAVLVHALRWLIGSGCSPESACCLYATAPFVRAEDLVRGRDVLRLSGACTAFTVTRFPSPLFRALKINPDGRLAMFWPEHRTTRSQDLPEAWHDAGQFYWLSVARYLSAPRLFSDDSAPISMPRIRVQDIDTPEDWETAEQLYAVLQQGRVP